MTSSCDGHQEVTGRRVCDWFVRWSPGGGPAVAAVAHDERGPAAARGVERAPRPPPDEVDAPRQLRAGHRRAGAAAVARRRAQPAQTRRATPVDAEVAVHAGTSPMLATVGSSFTGLNRVPESMMWCLCKQTRNAYS